MSVRFSVLRTTIERTLIELIRLCGRVAIRYGRHWLVATAVTVAIMRFSGLPCLAASPIEYETMPGSPLTVGGGFDPNNIAERKTICTPLKSVKPDPGGSNSIDFETYIATSAVAVRNVQHIDARLEAHNAFAKADISSSYDDSTERKTRSIYVVVKALVAAPSLVLYGRDGVAATATTPSAPSIAQKPPVAPVLTTDYEDLLRSNKQDFINQCGTKLVTAADRQTSVYAIFELSDTDNSLHHELGVKANLSAGYALVSGSLEFNTHALTDTVASEHRETIHIKTFGGPGLEAYEPLLKYDNTSDSTTTVGNVKKAMAEFLKLFGNAQPAIVKYHVTDMPGLTASDILYNAEKDVALEALLVRYRDGMRTSNYLNDLLTGSWYDLDEAQKARFTELRSKVLTYVNSVANAGTACRLASPNDLRACAPPKCAAFTKNASSDCDSTAAIFKVPGDAPPEYHPTYVEVRVVVNGELLTPSQSQAILATTVSPVPPFHERVHAFRTGATEAYEVLIIDNPYLNEIRSKVQFDSLKSYLDGSEKFSEKFSSRHSPMVVTPLPAEGGIAITSASSTKKPSFWHSDWPGTVVIVLQEGFHNGPESREPDAGMSILGADLHSLTEYVAGKCAQYVTWLSKATININISEKDPTKQGWPPSFLRIVQTGSLALDIRDRASPDEPNMVTLASFAATGPEWDRPPRFTQPANFDLETRFTRGGAHRITRQTTWITDPVQIFY